METKLKNETIITTDGVDVQEQARMDATRVAEAAKQLDRANTVKTSSERRLRGIRGVVSRLMHRTDSLEDQLWRADKSATFYGTEVALAKSGAGFRYQDNAAAYKQAAIEDARSNGVEVDYPEQDKDDLVVASDTKEGRMKKLSEAEKSHRDIMTMMGRGGDEISRSGGGFAYPNGQAVENIEQERSRLESDT